MPAAWRAIGDMALGRAEHAELRQLAQQHLVVRKDEPSLVERKDEIVEQALWRSVLWEEVKDDLKAPAQALSLGQQQRLCIARTLAVEPEVILMDEPCSALDPIATLNIEELMRQLKANYTIVIVTHNMQQAARVSDETGFFWLGELIEFDDTEAIFTRPAQELTEQYVTGRVG